MVFRSGIIIFLFMLNQSMICQKFEITRIIDSNLFELNDSTIVKLAGIDMPRLNHPEWILRNAAKKAVQYSEKFLLDKPFRIQVLSESDDYKLVYLIKSYPLNEKIMNISFLEEGFGRFLNNVDSSDIEQYTEAELAARKRNLGVWKSPHSRKEMIFDQEYNESEMKAFELSDSVKHLIRITPKPQPYHIACELVLGPAGGFIAAIPGAYLFHSLLDREGGEMNLNIGKVIGWYTGYLFGNAVSVYLIAESTTKDIDLGSMILTSIAGGILGTIFLASTTTSDSDWKISAPLFFPVIMSVIYANFFAPDKFPENNITYETIPDNKHLNAVDVYNRSKLFELDLLKISF